VSLILVPCAAAQSLQNQVLGLFPAQTGEITFLDVKSLRGSPHYAQLKEQVLPERFRSLVAWTQYIGIDFDTEVNQLSWAFLPPDAQGNVGLVGIAEGAFTLSELENEIKKRKLNFSRHLGHLVLTLGKNDAGQEFLFAFVDGATAVYGFREPVIEVLDRRAQNAQGLLGNRVMVDLVGQVNGKSPVWIVMDRRFTLLGVKQMLPNAETLPGFETVTSTLVSSILRFDLSNGMKSEGSVRCGSTADAAIVSTLMQAGLAYQTWRIKEANPELARVLGTMNVNSESQNVQLALSINNDDFLTLLSKNSFALKF
jgi:hypothetical protein